MTGREGQFSLQIGAEVAYRRQSYQLLRLEPYRRRDGAAITMAIWRSKCPQCARPFECRTATAAEKFKPVRRCEKCRQDHPWRGAPANTAVASFRPFAPVESYEDQSR
jgi:hypothetical protein